MKIKTFYKIAQLAGFSINNTEPDYIQPFFDNIKRNTITRKGIKPINSPIHLNNVQFGPEHQVDMADTEGAAMFPGEVSINPAESAW